MELHFAVLESLQKMLPPSRVESDLEILIPPPDIRSMVDKVARYVASIKPRLETIIGQNACMRKYSFLNGTDPYHAYYQHRLSEFRAQNGWSAQRTWTKGLVPEQDAIIEWIQERFESFEDSRTVTTPIVVSPITGELITVDKMSQHMLDPKYEEQKERLFAKIRETTLTQDDKISKSIVEVARKCPDIFGTTEEEICNAVKAEINPRLILDEPERKRQRLDESLLVPEDQFLAQNPGGPACINVWVPQKLELLKVSVESLSESVSSLKEKIAGKIGEAPPANKQKLELTEIQGVFKDNLSLAYYNIAGGELLSLSW